MGLGLKKKDVPQHYLCEQCGPDSTPQHQEFHDLVRNGEKPVAIAERRRFEAQNPKLKKTAKGGRKSTATPTKIEAADDTASTPLLSSPQVEQSKRKHVRDSDSPSANQQVHFDTHHSYQGRSDGLLMSMQPAKVRKSTGKAQRTGDKPQLDTSAENRPVQSISQLPHKTRIQVANALKSKLSGLIKQASSGHSYRIPDGHTADSLSEKHAVDVEAAMFVNYVNPGGNPPDFSGPYRNQMAIITNNLPRNNELLLRFLNGSITSNDLAKMSAADMASDEQKQKDAAMKAEADKQAMLVQDEGSRIRRTHKGEELIDDQLNQFASESITSTAPPRHLSSADGESKPPETPISAGPDGGFDQSQMRPRSESKGQPAQGASLPRRTSSNFDIQNVWSSVRSPTGQQPPHLSANQHANVGVKRDDRGMNPMLDENNDDSLPQSPAAYSKEKEDIWRGYLDMPTQPGHSIARFQAAAHFVAGSNLGGKEKQAAVFPTNLTIAGRIQVKLANEYIMSLAFSQSTDVAVFNVVPTTNDTASATGFDTLFNYFTSKDRYGVISSSSLRDGVRDAYIFPLEEGVARMPDFMEALEDNVIELPRPRRMLLVVLVVKHRSPPSSAQPTPTQHAAPTSALSPSRPSAGPISNAALQTAPSMSPTQGQMDGAAHPPPPQAQQQQRQAPPPYPQPQYPPPSGAQQQPHHAYPPGAAAPLAPPPQHPPATNQEYEHDKWTILGSYMFCASAQKLLSETVVPKETLHNLKRVFDEHPQARDNWDAFNHAIGGNAPAPPQQ